MESNAGGFLMSRRKHAVPLPEDVRLGPYSFTVGFEKALNRSSLLGETHGSDLNILLNPSQHPMVLRETVVHELLHACFAVSSLTHALSDEEEERIVAILSPWLLMLLRDNADMLAWVCDG